MTTYPEMMASDPVLSDVELEYEEFRAALVAAQDASAIESVVLRWDALRRRLETWSALVELRFEQATDDPAAKQAREFRDELQPHLTELEIAFKRLLLEPGRRRVVEAAWGTQAPALWEVDLLTFDPVLKDDLVTESKLTAEYTELLASASLCFRDQHYNLESISQFHESPHRDVRHDSLALKWHWFADHSAELDRIFADLVTLRTNMARKLGCRDFVELGYRRMARLDYGQQDVVRFRRAVEEHVVPLADSIRRQQGERLGVRRLMFWDESVHDLQGNPRPRGGHDWMLDRAQEMFDALGPDLGEFFRRMRTRQLLDLQIRPGKAGGGFCTAFPLYEAPFIFANFKGTKGDVEVFTHEMGHAFQNAMSQQQPLLDYHWPTCESCEIHSMSLEFLTWPQMEKFFDDDAERFRQMHLAESLVFLPYGVAVDHFQHEIYARPQASAEQRHQIWREMEARYLPWRDYGDLPYLDRGGRWQLQRHIYLQPFYYIDYTLALACALQFWIRSEQDPGRAVADFVALCRRGGSAPFQALVQSAGLRSPLERGCLQEVVLQAANSLE